MVAHKLLIFAFAASLAACSNLRPADPVETARARLLGKWQAKGSIYGVYCSGCTDMQFELFADGSVAESGKSKRGWQQLRTGTFKCVDATHIKIDEGWEWGTTIYQTDWRDNNHVTLRAADNLTIPLHRIK